MAERRLRIATYNIHKGVQGPVWRPRLEIENIKRAIDGLDVDIMGLQEVRGFNRRFAQKWSHWPEVDQAEAVAPAGFASVYASNAVTRHGEHGNALVSRWPLQRLGHRDISDHRLEQRGLLHSAVVTPWGELHVIVLHLGLSAGTRWRQVERLAAYVDNHVGETVPLVVMGDFNDWHGRLHAPMADLKLEAAVQRCRTFPARWPVWSLDRIYARGLQPVSANVPHGRAWARWSDHLPLITEWRW